MIILTIIAMLATAFSSVMLCKDNTSFSQVQKLVLIFSLILGSLGLGLLFSTSAQANVQPRLYLEGNKYLYEDDRVSGYISTSDNGKFTLAVFCLREEQALATMIISQKPEFTNFIRKGEIIATMMIIPNGSNFSLPWLRLDLNTLIRHKVDGYQLPELVHLKNNPSITFLYANKLIRFNLAKAKASITEVERICDLMTS